MKRTALFLAIWLGMTGLLLSRPQTANDQGSGHQPLIQTRWQVLFSDLELQLLKAQQQPDEATINRLLDEDFQVWTPAPPGDPTPREDWVRQVKAKKLASFQMHQLAAHDMGGSCVLVNFVLTETRPVAGAAATTYFVVDVWTRRGEDWRLTDRYLSPTTGGTRLPLAKPSGKN